MSETPPENAEKGQEPFPSRKSEDNSGEKEKNRYWPHCTHSRFTRLEKFKKKDRLEILKECRRCGHQRVFVTQRDFNSMNVYVKAYWYDVPKRGRQSPDDA